MVELDDTDLHILQLLTEDSRRPFSEIADKVGVSPPTVSDRVDRLDDLGVIERFTLDLNRSRLCDGVGVLVDLHVRPDSVQDLVEGLAPVDGVDHVYATADSHVIARATVDETEIHEILTGTLDLTQVVEYEVRLLVDAVWEPTVGVEDSPSREEQGTPIPVGNDSVELDSQ